MKYLILFMLLSSLAYAHQDTIIKLEGNKLIGLPNQST
ncbi:hypothetical protein PCIT_a1893 [Pseudoalteromonas citrea]|uniref:Uncharacterized protein n=1 Tax=Pseudoalteromonas citrea TaxID=43655 RepID=A0AAD4FS74_9GAMM|nr:hypothetical protein PCIT_a1893 [Pseudoalteromonas citrea]